MEMLTKRQEAVMRFLRKYVSEHGYPPTVREIGGHFGFTWPAARGYLKALQKKGAIRLRPHKSRGIEIPGMRSEAVGLPLVGGIRAGRPVLAVEEFGERIFVDSKLFRHEDAFTLRVRGESMKEAGILDGDYVVVKTQETVTNGETGVVLIGDEATVKKVYVKGDSVTLPTRPAR
jgi:repressor LexA